MVLPLESHKVSLSYIRENKKEALLYVDTLGTISENVKNALKVYGKKNKIIIYRSKEPYQKDNNSCGVMSTVIGRDITSKTKLGNHYKYGELLPYLQKHAKYLNKTLKDTTLPIYLVKLSQYPDRFEEMIQDKSMVNVHEGKEENLENFLKRYKKMVKTRTKGTMFVDSYTVSKGIKFQSLIIMLFYLEQVKSLFFAKTGFELSPVLQLQFIYDIKLQLRPPHNKNMSNEFLMTFSEEFLKIAISNKGVYSYTQISKDFLADFFQECSLSDITRKQGLK